ncbi:hypothetical protein NCS55_01213800 [Fusarium keratoplasticum]|nr:hypothetical protein NCS55_01213800 [Fusarium keratoplasticum]
MTQSPLVLHVCHPGLCLSGVEAQNLRRLIRRCRIALTAIHEPQSPSLLQLILPLGLQSLSILHGLLALSVRGEERSSHDLQHHQLALGELRKEIQEAGLNPISTHRAHKVLALCLLLSLFTLPRCDGSWVQHHRGMLSLLRSLDQSAIISDPLGRFLLSISWLSWMLPRSRERPGITLTSLEATIGYPETLIDIIAQISEFSDDNYYLYLRSLHHGASNDAMDSEALTRTSAEFETSLKDWSIPKLPGDMSSFQQLAVRLAWETMRKASLLFLWRNCGFHANLSEPIRPDKKTQADSCTEEIITNIRAIFDMGRVHQFSIGNAMLWAVTIVACECTWASQEQRDRVMQLVDDMGRLYTMDHVKNLRTLLVRLWERSREPSPGYLSLEHVCQDMEMVVPLF